MTKRSTTYPSRRCKLARMAGGTAYDKAKLKQLLLYVARRCADDPTFGQTKLNKILWFSDFEAYRTLGRSITGGRYQRLPEGPALVAMIPVVRELTEDGSLTEVSGGAGPKHRRPKALALENMSAFTDQETQIVDRWIEAFWAMPAAKVSWLSHQSKAWRLTQHQQEIPYAMAVLSPDDPSDDDLSWLEELGAALGA